MKYESGEIYGGLLNESEMACSIYVYMSYINMYGNTVYIYISQGVFKTQRLNKYPVPLCRALAQLSFVHAMARGHDVLCQDPSPKMGEMLSSLRSEVGEGSLGPDYCATAVQKA